MTILNSILFALLITLNCCYSQKSPTYRAAVVEVDPHKNVTNQFIDIIKSPDVKDVDIIVFPEAILNQNTSEILLPNSTVFCDDPNAHSVLRDISCAARTAKMYVVIDAYTIVNCSMDDQSFCVNKEDNTNEYNMAFVFDRNGATIAKYRKFHLWGEQVQTPEKPDMITFDTDFNVTFGVFICFDMLFESPATNLVDKGIRHFVYPTMWPLELPFMNANQFQQSWAYGNDVVLLAANANWGMKNASITSTSGSGIYAGRWTLDVFFSETPATKILIADVPINLPSSSTVEEKNMFAKSAAAIGNLSIALEMNNTATQKQKYDKHVDQEDMKLFTIKFLDFSLRLRYNGSICNGDFCCKYDVDVDDNGSSDEKPSYVYAIAVFSGYRKYVPIKEVIPNLFTHQSVCGLIACGEIYERDSCAKRFSIDVNYRYNFKKLSFTMTPPSSRAKNIMASTLSNDLFPLNAKEFELKTSKMSDAQNYTATLTLKMPKSDLLTFAIFVRDYQKDKLNDGSSANILKYNYYVYILFVTVYILA